MNPLFLVAAIVSINAFPHVQPARQAAPNGSVPTGQSAIASIENAMDILPGSRSGAAASDVGFALNHTLPGQPCSASWRNAQGLEIDPTVDEAMVFYSACNLIQAPLLSSYVPTILSSIPQHQ